MFMFLLLNQMSWLGPSRMEPTQHFTTLIVNCDICYDFKYVLFIDRFVCKTIMKIMGHISCMWCKCLTLSYLLMILWCTIDKLLLKPWCHLYFRSCHISRHYVFSSNQPNNTVTAWRKWKLKESGVKHWLVV